MVEDYVRLRDVFPWVRGHPVRRGNRYLSIWKHICGLMAIKYVACKVEGETMQLIITFF
jgi:hypothetical protein